MQRANARGPAGPVVFQSRILPQALFDISGCEYQHGPSTGCFDRSAHVTNGLMTVCHLALEDYTGRDISAVPQVMVRHNVSFQLLVMISFQRFGTQ